MNNSDYRFMTKAEHLQWQLEQQQAQLRLLNQQLNTVQRRPAAPPAARPRRQSAVKERLDKMTEYEWQALADKTQPLPDELSRQPEMLLKELGFFLLAQHIGKWDL